MSVDFKILYIIADNLKILTVHAHTANYVNFRYSYVCVYLTPDFDIFKCVCVCVLHTNTC